MMMVMDKNGGVGKVTSFGVAMITALSIVVGGAAAITHQFSEISERLDRNLVEIKVNREANAVEHKTICLAHKQLDFDLRLHILSEGNRVPLVKRPEADC